MIIVKRKMINMGNKGIEEKFDKNFVKQMEKKNYELNLNEKSTQAFEDIKKNDEINYIDKKEELKDIHEMKKILQRYNPKLLENFELVNYCDYGGESLVYNVLVKTRNKEGKNSQKKAIMKAILFHRRENDNKRQIYISSKLKNKNVIDFYVSSKMKDGTFLMFMEDAKYGHLRNFLRKTVKRNTFSEAMLCYLAYQILNGIAYCHKCKIAHLDIKLQNIVINEYLDPKLIDFSISYNYENKSRNDFIELPRRGTNFYMPKELIRGDKIRVKDLNKVDLYSFGVVLYNLAFNCYPRDLTHGDEENYDTILRKIEKNELSFKNDNNYSPYFLDFLKQLLEVNINKRIDIDAALNHYWIKGAQILLDEKEKCYNLGNFTSYLITDHIKNFNDYLKKKY